MRYYSTKSPTKFVDFKTAVMTGLPPDNGLYMPEQIPTLPKEVVSAMPDWSLKQIAHEMALRLIGDGLPAEVLESIIDRALSFEIPLVALSENLFVLELFHGPTLAFKDVAARFMAEVMGYFAQQDTKQWTILVATSGDTGSAVANGFFRVPGISVVVLYPSGKVSPIQKQQMTTLGENIHAIEIAGSFDDCQNLVKTAFLDSELRQKFALTSANSINIARLIPQSFYYAYTYAQLSARWGRDHAVISVPSGNFGNLTAGLFARKMGIPVRKFVAATNINNVVPKYLQSGLYQPQPTRHTYSNAMDVGKPSNFERILALYNHNHSRIAEDIYGCYFDDQQTVAAIKAIYEAFGYIVDPHGAIGYLGIEKFRNANDKADFAGVFLETAHPVKFPDVIREALGIHPPQPAHMQALSQSAEKVFHMENSFEKLKEFLLDLS
jgi:threonine synthase